MKQRHCIDYTVLFGLLGASQAISDRLRSSGKDLHQGIKGIVYSFLVLLIFLKASDYFPQLFHLEPFPLLMA